MRLYIYNQHVQVRSYTLYLVPNSLVTKPSITSLPSWRNVPTGVDASLQCFTCTCALINPLTPKQSDNYYRSIKCQF